MTKITLLRRVSFIESLSNDHILFHAFRKDIILYIRFRRSIYYIAMKIFMTYVMCVFIIYIFTYALLSYGIMLLYFVRSCDRERYYYNIMVSGAK